MKARITKTEVEKQILETHEKALKEQSIKSMVQGFEISNNMILDYINNGYSLDEVKSFVEKNCKTGGKTILKTCDMNEENDYEK